MAQNTPEIIEVPALQSQQVKRNGSDADQHRKRLRTDDTMDIEVVPKENDEKYATKEDVNIIMERISKIESRVAKIERTFESLKSAFLGPNYPSRAISSSASCAPGPTPSASKSSNSSSTSAAMSAERTPSSAMISSKEASPSVVQPALSTRTAPAMSTLQTPLSSAAQSAQQAPLSSPAKSAQKTPLPAAARSVLGTPNSSASKSAQVTPISSASKSAQVTPISSASKSAQVTPISSALKSAQVTPISSGGKSVQVTPISSTGVSAQVTVTPISSAGKSAQVTSISSAPKPIQRTPPSGAKSVQGTSSSAPTSFYETTPLGKKSTQGISTSGAKSAQAPSIGVSKPVKAPSTTQSAQSTSSPAVAPPASNLRHRPAVNSVQGSLTSAVQRKNIEAIDDEVTVIPTDDSEIAPVSIGTNKPRINVIPQKELFAVPPDQPTSERNRQSHNQQRSGSRVVSNVASQTRSQQLASTSSSSTSIRAQTSSHEGAQTNMNESWSSSGAIDVSDMPEEVFSLIPPKQEIYDNPEGGKIESSTNKQLVAYIDGDCRKKKNHDIYAAVAGYSLNGTKIYSVPYVSDLKRPFTHNMPAVKANRKMVELVKQQTEVMAAYLFISGFKSLGASCNDTLKVVSRCQRLVQIMKGPRDVYPCINTCQCDRFPCNHSRRWETLDNFAHSLSDDLPRLVLATKRAGINVEWCNYSPFDQEEKKITESLKKDFKKKISELLSKTNPNTRPS